MAAGNEVLMALLKEPWPVPDADYDESSMDIVELAKF